MLANILKGASASPVIFASGVNLANQTSNDSRTLTLNSGFAVGDMLIAMTGNRTTTPPTLLSGYTDIVSLGDEEGSANRSFRVQYKIATSTSETITWTGATGYLIAFKNATRIGQAQTLNDNSNGSIMRLPDLNNLQTSNRCFILAGSYPTGIYTEVTTPYTLFSPYGARISQNNNSSITGELLTASSQLVNIAYAIEII
jgi:hypothetical protein